MTGRLGRAALALGLVQLIGCAQGYDTGLDDDPPMAGGFAAGTGPMGSGRGGSASQAGRSAGSGGAGTMMYTGEPCERGQTEECECDAGMGMGIRTCRKDDASPTMGTFSECESCTPDPGDVGSSGMGGAGTGQSGSGSAGSGGAGGSTGRAGSSSGSAGRTSGGSGTGGRSGGAGSGSGNDPAWCLFVPVPIPGVCD